MEGHPERPRFNASFLRSAHGWPYLLVPLIPVAVALELVHAPATAIFVAAALGIIPTAALMGRATEELAARSGPGIGGLLNVTFGNAPELIIALFALSQGLQEVVKASIVGSILGNILLVLGVAMLAGGLGREKQTFSRTGASVQTHDADAGRGGAGDAGDLRAGRGPGAAESRGRGGQLRRDRRAPLAGRRDRPHRHLCGRSLLLAQDPSRDLQPRVRGGGHLGLVDPHLGDRPGGRRRSWSG